MAERCKSRFSYTVVDCQSTVNRQGCGFSRFRSAQSLAIPLSVWSASISPAHWSNIAGISRSATKRAISRVEKVRMFWLPSVSVGDPAAKRQLPFGSTVNLASVCYVLEQDT